MNPMTVELFFNSRKIKHRFLDMCTTHGGTAEEIFQKMNNVIVQNQINWNHCIGLSVDNTVVNMGIRNGLKAKVLNENEKIYVMGCPYHIIHNIDLAGSKAFVSECGFDTNDFAVDNYYWLDKSTNRKNLPQDFRDFDDLINDEMISFIKKLCGKFLPLDELKNTSSLLQANVLNQVSDSKLFIGYLTRQRLRELEDDGLECTKIVKFFSAVRKFYEATFSYAVKNLPFDDIVLKHAKFVNEQV